MLERAFAPFTRRWGWARTALAVQNRVSEVNGGALASSITLACFLSLFPLLLALIGLLGFLSASAGDLPVRVVNSIGLGGEAAILVKRTIAHAEQTRRAASIIGIVGLLWSGLGLVGALQNGMNSIWQTQGRGIKDKLVGLQWLVGAVVLLGISLGFTAALRLVPGPGWVPAILGSIAAGVALWLWTLVILPNHHVGWRALLPAAVFGALGLELLKVVGGFLVPRSVAGSSALYGSLGVVFAVLGWLLVLGRLIVYTTVLGVIHWEEHHGTVTADIEVPHIPGAVPLVTTRAGDALPT